MIKKCREKAPIFNYIKYDGTNAIECSSLNKFVFKVSEDGKLQHNVWGEILDVDIGSYVVVGRGYGVYSEKEFYARFEDVDDLTETPQPLPDEKMESEYEVVSKLCVNAKFHRASFFAHVKEESAYVCQCGMCKVKIRHKLDGYEYIVTEDEYKKLVLGVSE